MPGLICSRKSAVRSVERKLSAARKKLAADELLGRRKFLERKVSTYELWMSTVFPTPVLPADVLELQSAQEELAEYK